MDVARNVICWSRLTELFPSDTPGCDRSGWRGRGSRCFFVSGRQRHRVRVNKMLMQALNFSGISPSLYDISTRTAVT